METQTHADPFVWDGSYNHHEQVRPYLADFLAIKAELTERGEYPYNSSFNGKIPGLANSAQEDTAIYMLQNLARLDEDRARTQAFIDAGGYRLADRMPEPTERGTLVHVGFYMGGTGWSEWHNATVSISETGYVRFRLPRQRNHRTHYAGPQSYLFSPNPN